MTSQGRGNRSAERQGEQRKKVDVGGEHTKEDERLVLRLFNVKEAGQVPRGALIRQLAYVMRVVERLSTELYCAVPEHEVFERNSAEQLVRYEKVRQLRERKRETAWGAVPWRKRRWKLFVRVE